MGGDVMAARPDAAALILAGGEGRRMDGVDKAALELGGSTLLERAVAAVRAAGIDEIVAVGPARRTAAAVRWVREEPALSGPAAAIAVGVSVLSAPEVFVLAVDLVSPDAAATALRAARLHGDGVVLEDAEGRPQWLAARYRTTALRARAEMLGAGIRGASVRDLVSGLDLRRLPAAGATDDVDSWDHLREARAGRRGAGRSDMSERTLPPEALDEWAGALRERFGLAPGDLPIAAVLDLARDVANGVARPAAPFSAFVAGLVAGRDGGSPDRVREVLAEITAMAEGWAGR